MQEQMPQLEEQFERLRNLPDQFNRAFLPSGWIATDDMSVTAMEEAIRLHDQRDIEAAETYLEDYYDKDLDFLLRGLWRLPRVKKGDQYWIWRSKTINLDAIMQVCQ